MDNKVDLSLFEKEAIAKEAAKEVISIARLYKVPDEFLNALTESYKAGAVNAINRLREFGEKQFDEFVKKQKEKHHIDF